MAKLFFRTLVLSFGTVAKSFTQGYRTIMPCGAGALFFIQIFATIAFSVLYSTLVLYITHTFKLSDTLATSITASFIAFNYSLHLLGGFAGGRYLSYRSLFLLGMITQIAGCTLIAYPNMGTLFWGLALFLTGAGLNVTCINCMVTQLFKPEDKCRETAFLWNYSGMNIGFFVGFTMSGYFQLQSNYHELFILSGLGNFLAFVFVIAAWKKLADRDTIFSLLQPAARKIAALKGIALVVLLIFGLRWLLGNSDLSNKLVLAVGALMAIILAVLAAKRQDITERKHLYAYLILAFASIAFWTLYQLAPMGLTLFTERNIDRHLWGMVIPPQWIQNINTIVIVIGGPILSIFFAKLRERGIPMTIPVQFSLAIVLIGAAFAILPIGIHFANAEGLSSFQWIVWCYVLQSLGELFISPIGYAMVGQLAPPKMQGLLMGTWMMITGVSSVLSDYSSNLALGNTHSTNPLLTNASFSHTFGMFGGICIAIGIALFAIKPLVQNLMQEREGRRIEMDEVPVTTG